MPGGHPCVDGRGPFDATKPGRHLPPCAWKPGPQKPTAWFLVMHLPLTLICPLPQADFADVMGTQLSVSGTGFESALPEPDHLACPVDQRGQGAELRAIVRLATFVAVAHQPGLLQDPKML